VRSNTEKPRPEERLTDKKAEKQERAERITDQSEIMREAETRGAANIPLRSMQRTTNQKNG
jgi:hypothetical protein